MQEHFETLAAQAKTSGARDDNRRLVNPMDICGNPLEDLLVQVRSQLRFASHCMRDEPADPAAKSQLHDIVHQILDSAARATMLICTCANMYFGMYYILYYYNSLTNVVLQSAIIPPSVSFVVRTSSDSTRGMPNCCTAVRG